MASLALGVAGAFVGSLFGPIGASIGWSLGAMLGSALDPQKIQGPRLSDLKLQNSTYGTMIPIVYGTARIAGNVIWQTDLVEHQATDGGKGGPEVTTYSYTASFAIRVCEGPIVAIRKMWADSRLVVDNTEGSSVRSLPYTLYLGTETQDVDPTMEAELGAGEVPAYRGVAYVVFTDLDLTEFANRIPNWTFEVMQRGNTDDELRISAIAADQLVAYGNGSFGDPSSTAVPQILTWPLDGNQIRVTDNQSTSIYSYDPTTLIYDNTSARGADDRFPVNTPISTYYNGTFQYYPVGRWISNGGEMDVWYDVACTLSISAAGYAPTLACGTVYYDSGSDFPKSGYNVAHEVGIPAGEYVGAASLSRDKKALFIFTGPTATGSNASVIDKWYRIMDDAIVDSGTVSPALSKLDLGFGQADKWQFCGNGFENNYRWMWHVYGAAGGSFGGGVTCFHIDDAGNFAYFTAGGNEGLTELINGYSAYPYPAIMPLQPGYAGVIANDVVAVFTRFPLNDSSAAPLDEVVADLSDRAGLATSEYDVTVLDQDLVPGYVIASQASVRSALEPLQIAFAFSAVESDGAVKFVKLGGGTVATIADDDLAATTGDLPALMTTARTQEADLPRTVYVNYLDIGLDYQQGTQLAARQTTQSEKDITVAVPVCLVARNAKGIAERVLFNSWIERERFSISLPRKYEYLEPTDVISARNRKLRLVTKSRATDRTIKFDAVLTHSSVYNQPGIGSSSGIGFIPPVIKPDQRTNLLLLDLPLLHDNDFANGFYAVTTPDLSPSWSGASLFKSYDGGTNYVALQDSVTAGTVGTASTTLGTWSGPNVFDETNVLTVALTAGSGTLASATEINVLNGANLALIGSELIQFKNATLTGTRTYDLSGLLRGRRGTEAYIATHAAAESFVLLSSAINVEGPFAELNAPRYYKAVTRGKPLSWGTATAFTNAGRALKPYSPCELGGGRDGSSNLTLSWKRRTRVGGEWVDYVDAWLSESTEYYTVTIYTDSYYATVKRTHTLVATSWDYTAATQVTDFGSTQSIVYWTVEQIGSIGNSVPTRGAT